MAAFAVAACGDDESPMMEEPPPPPPTTTVRYEVNNPCTDDVPEPNDLFIDANGDSERVACPELSDPVENAVFSAMLGEGAPLDAVVTLPVNGTLDATSLSSTVTFSFTSTTGPNVPQEGLPPVVMLKQVGVATAAAGWEIVSPEVSFTGGRIRLQPTALLDEGTRYVVIATRGLRDLEMPQGKLAQSEVVAAVVASTPVVANDLETVDSAGAARLERQRQALQPLVNLLATETNPPIARSDIVSMHSFTTQQGVERLVAEVARYYEAIDRGRYGYDVTLTEVVPASVFIGIPGNAYPDVATVYRGVITAPRFLGDDGRWRDDWDQVVETVDIHFTITEPAGISAAGVVLHIPGYGRGSVDGRSIAQSMSQVPAVYVMTVDMRCHGFRSPNAAGDCVENRTTEEINDLIDAEPNNGNPDILGADGIPDDSGIGFFSGDLVALRDGQMATILEIVHLLESLTDPDNYDPDVSVVVSRLHVIAQGYMAPLALIATTYANATGIRTFSMPSGGTGLAEIVLNAAPGQKNEFLSGLPNGINESNVAEVLGELSVMFSPVEVGEYRDAIQSRFSSGPRFERVLLSHPSVEEFITEDARNQLISDIGLSSGRVSEHLPTCDDFYLYSCVAGQDVIQQQTAVEQLVRFVDSNGVTVVDPAR